MRRWGLFLTLLVMAGVLSVQYYYGLKVGRVDGDATATLIYNWVIPVVWVALAGWLGARMFAHKNRDGLMVGASLVVGLFLVAGLFTGFAHNGGKESAEKDMALNDAKKAVQNAINNWDEKKNGPVTQFVTNGVINYKALGYGGCPGVNESRAACPYKFTLDAEKKVTFVNQTENRIVDPVMDQFGLLPAEGTFSLFDLLGWLGFVVAFSANLYLLMESFVGIEMPVDLIYEEGVEAR